MDNYFDKESFYELYADYLSQKQSSTKESYLKYIKPFFIYLEKKAIIHPTYHDIERYFDDLINQPSKTYILINDITYDDVSEKQRRAVALFLYKDRTSK